MNTRGRRRALLGGFAGLVLLVLLFFGFQAWLSSGVGRGVVESRLSAAFGRPVLLGGNFSVGLLPVPGASGTDLKLYTPDGRWLALGAESYLAELALWPLLKGEVEVVSLSLAGAGLDLARLASVQGGDSAEAGPFSQIPAVRSFELENVSLYFDGMRSQPYIRIGSLSLDDFAVDVAAPFETVVSLVSEKAEALGLSVRGRVNLQSKGAVELDLSFIDFSADGWGATALEGTVVGDFEGSELQAKVWSNSTTNPFAVGVHIAWDPVFSGGESGYLIEALEFESGEQRVAGSGCLMIGTPPVLHLSLSAPYLDLDAFQALLEGLRQPDPANPEGTQPEMGKEAGLPFELAFLLKVETASFDNAAAEGIRLRSGPTPACPDLK